MLLPEYFPDLEFTARIAFVNLNFLIIVPEYVPDLEYTARIAFVNLNFLILLPESVPDPEYIALKLIKWWFVICCP